MKSGDTYHGGSREEEEILYQQWKTQKMEEQAKGRKLTGFEERKLQLETDQKIQELKA